MTKPLAERVREFLEFPVRPWVSSYSREAARSERARTKAVDALWPEVVDFLTDYAEECDCGDCYVCDAATLLFKLEQAVPGENK